MSIQPNRIVNRIIQQVDQSDWPALSGRVFSVPETGEWVRVYQVEAQDRYATAIHFWVHALREELTAVGRRADLASAAGHALGRPRTLKAWIDELEGIAIRGGPSAAEALALRDIAAAAECAAYPNEVQVHRMLESECRRSSVFETKHVLVADFWGHGAGASWRRSAR